MTNVLTLRRTVSLIGFAVVVIVLALALQPTHTQRALAEPRGPSSIQGS